MFFQKRFVLLWCLLFFSTHLLAVNPPDDGDEDSDGHSFYIRDYNVPLENINRATTNLEELSGIIDIGEAALKKQIEHLSHMFALVKDSQKPDVPDVENKILSNDFVKHQEAIQQVANETFVQGKRLLIPDFERVSLVFTRQVGPCANDMMDIVFYRTCLKTLGMPELKLIDLNILSLLDAKKALASIKEARDQITPTHARLLVEKSICDELLLVRGFEKAIHENGEGRSNLYLLATHTTEVLRVVRGLIYEMRCAAEQATLSFSSSTDRAVLQSILSIKREALERLLTTTIWNNVPVFSGPTYHAKTFFDRNVPDASLQMPSLSVEALGVNALKLSDISLLTVESSTLALDSLSDARDSIEDLYNRLTQACDAF